MDSRRKISLPLGRLIFYYIAQNSTYACNKCDYSNSKWLFSLTLMKGDKGVKILK